MIFVKSVSTVCLFNEINLECLPFGCVAKIHVRNNHILFLSCKNIYCLIDVYGPLSAAAPTASACLFPSAFLYLEFVSTFP